MPPAKLSHDEKCEIVNQPMSSAVEVRLLDGFQLIGRLAIADILVWKHGFSSDKSVCAARKKSPATWQGCEKDTAVNRSKRSGHKPTKHDLHEIGRYYKPA
jgi:hypothetical protein